jgi:hypothetical protein
VSQPTSAIELRAFDPLQYRVPLPLREMLYPLGFPMEIHTNDARVIASAQESWGHSQQQFSTPAMQVRIAVSGVSEGGVPANHSFRAQGHLLAIVSDAANYAVCDLETAFAFCWLTPGAVQTSAWVRHFFLEAIAYCVLTHLYVTGIHAGCIAKNGRGLLLSAPSGVGKSVLSLACARAGWTFVTDDVAYVVRDQGSRTVLGKPERMKFLPSAAELFPDIHWGDLAKDQKGDPFVELRTNQMGLLTTNECPVDYLVFLKRSADGRPQLTSVRSDDAFARLVSELPVFEDTVHEAHRQSIRMLAQLETLELSYADLDDAVDLLNELVGGA